MKLRVMAAIGANDSDRVFLITKDSDPTLEAIRCSKCNCEYFVWDSPKCFDQALKNQKLMINETTTVEFNWYECLECGHPIDEQVQPFPADKSTVTYTFRTK